MIEYFNQLQQSAINYNYRECLKYIPLRDKFCFEHGHFIVGGILFAANIIVFRCGFRAFKMVRYNRGRLISFIMSSSFSIQAGIIHKILVTDPILVEPHRESMWKYGTRSFIANQFAFPAQATFALGCTFLNAQLNGMIPVKYGFLDKGRRMETLRFILKSLKPYSGTLTKTYLITSALTFFIGCREYSDSCTILKHVNRRTLCQNEDSLKYN